MNSQTIQQPDTQRQIALLDELHRALTRIKPIIAANGDEDDFWFVQMEAGKALGEAFGVCDILSLATEHTERAQRPVSGEGHSETSVNSVANSLPEDTHA